MEFQYRAGDDERRRSPSPLLAPTVPVRASASGDEILPSACNTERDRCAALDPPAGEEARRREREKARIRDRILRKETLDRFDLELEVRLELVERFRKRAGGLADHQTQAAPAIAANTSSSPVVPKENSNTNARVAASPAKRKSPVDGAGSTASKDTSNKKQKISLTCTVCGITANAEKAMQDHLNGKTHKRKQAAALAVQPTTKQEPDYHGAEEDEDAVVTTAPPERSDDDGFTATRFTMVTDAGTLNEVTQMDGYLLCEVCNVRAADRVTMMCHFRGTKHISKAKKAAEAQAKGASAVHETVSQREEEPFLNAMEGKAGDRTSERQDTMATTADQKVVGAVESSKAIAANGIGVMEVDGVRHPVQRLEGTLLCPCCNVKATSEVAMRSHLAGKKHKHKMTKSSAAPTAGGAGSELPTATKADNVAGAGAAAVAQPKELDAPTNQVDEALPGATEPVFGEPVAGDGATEPAGKPVTVYADGEMFTVLRHEDGRFSCAPCGVRRCNKDAMFKHLYAKDAQGQSTCRGKE